MTLGARLRQLRLRQQRTLQEIADLCGFTRSLLSKIENDKTVPPVATLARLAAALGVKASALLDEESTVGTVVQRAAEVAAAPLVRTDRGYHFFAFAAGRPDKRMQPFLFVARRGEVKRHHLSHAGEEFIYVLEGQMRYRVGQTEYHLEPGDTLYFDSEEEHAIEPVSAEVRYLGIFAEAALAPRSKAKRPAGQRK